MPVIDSMLVKIGGLWFIDLFLGVATTDGTRGDVVAVVSDEFFGLVFFNNDAEVYPQPVKDAP